MFRDLIGVQEQIANKIDAVLLERKAHADCRVGRQISAMANGFQEDFLGKVLIEENDFSARSLVALQNSDYILSNTSKHFMVSTAATNIGATAGLIEPDGTTRRGLLRLSLGNAATTAMGFHQEDVFWLHGNQNFEIKIALDTCSGLELPIGQGAFQFGVCAALTGGVTVLTAPSADYCYVEIVQGLIRIVARSGAGVVVSPWSPFSYPDGRIVVGLLWGASGRTAHVTINDKTISSLQIPETNTIVGKTLQLFGRVGHSGTYDDTPDNPIRVDIEAIQAIQYNNAAAPFRAE